MLSEFALSPIHRRGVSSAFHGAAATRTRRIRRVAVEFDLPVTDGPIICGLLRTVEAHNPGSLGHALRVCQLARKIAKAINLSDHAVATITEAALLHDIGKIAIDAHILRKPGTLNEAERKAVRLHVPAGVGLVGAIPALGRAAVLIRASHEWLDGSGYPRGLRGTAIPIGSRIISAADAFDVLTHARTYSRPLTPARAVRELRASAGMQFDPLVVIALEQIVLHPPAQGACSPDLQDAAGEKDGVNAGSLVEKAARHASPRVAAPEPGRPGTPLYAS